MRIIAIGFATWAGMYLSVLDVPCATREPTQPHQSSSKIPWMLLIGFVCISSLSILRMFAQRVSVSKGLSFSWCQFLGLWGAQSSWLWQRLQLTRERCRERNQPNYEDFENSKDLNCVGGVSYNRKNAAWPRLHKYNFREVPQGSTFYPDKQWANLLGMSVEKFCQVKLFHLKKKKHQAFAGIIRKQFFSKDFCGPHSPCYFWCFHSPILYSVYLTRFS